jgi:hypothetical protein
MDSQESLAPIVCDTLSPPRLPLAPRSRERAPGRWRPGPAGQGAEGAWRRPLAWERLPSEQSVRQCEHHHPRIIRKAIQEGNRSRSADNAPLHPPSA